jgi:hypothetical protein
VNAVLRKYEQVIYENPVDANVFESNCTGCLCLKRIHEGVHRGIWAEGDGEEAIAADLAFNAY